MTEPTAGSTDVPDNDRPEPTPLGQLPLLQHSPLVRDLATVPGPNSGAATPGRSAPRATARPSTHPTAAEGSTGQLVDWALVGELRIQIAEQLREAGINLSTTVTEQDHDTGRELISTALRAYTRSTITSPGGVLSTQQETATAAALFDAVFRLGRWQPLMDEPDITDIEITGHDHVRVLYPDGRIEPRHPVADSDDALIRDIQALAEQRGKRFAYPSDYFLELALEDQNARLTAIGWRSHRPLVRIRKDPLDRPSIEELVRRDMLDEELAAFLIAAVRAHKSVVVSGAQGSGKALALDTEVPTPHGWTTMGELRTGDVVFDDRGTPCTVLAAHEVQQDRSCFEMTFDDGSTVVADAEHLWRVTRREHRDRSSHRQRAKGPYYSVEPDERARLHALAASSAEEPDRDVSVADLLIEVGTQHRDLLYEEAAKLGPTGHRPKTWLGGYGALSSRDIRVYSRQLLLKALAIRRDTPANLPSDAPPAVVLTTQEIANAPIWAHADKPWRTHEFSVDLARALAYPHKEQFIDPYVLGVWLGDGATAAARVTTADPQVLDELEKAGYPHSKVKGSKYDYGVGGSLHSQLRVARVLGDKHIPRPYLQGDIEQRRALLQGLMDSDGTADRSGTLEFTSTLQVLAEQVHELTRSLGYKATLTSKLVTWKGKPCGRSYIVRWTAADPAFRLPRKLQRQALNHGGPTRRYIVSVQQVPSVPVRCITVDSPSSLFLVTRSCIPTHNTTLLRALARCIPDGESVATLETERELFLHDLLRNRAIISLDAAPGGTEFDPSGRRAGRVDLQDIFPRTLRLNLDRIIVGEVRGSEIMTMFMAMQAGAGSLSTIHARNAADTISRLVTAANMSNQIDIEQAYRLVAQHIDLIVHVHAHQDPHTGIRARYVDEVLHLRPGSDSPDGIARTTVFWPPKLGERPTAQPGVDEDFLADLRYIGYTRNPFTTGPLR